MLTIIPPAIVDRPNGKFFEGYFYWYHSWYGCEYEEEWGRRWLESVNLDFATIYPLYYPTGITRKWEG